jgi:uncharacterized protein (TIGR03083 family)
MNTKSSQRPLQTPRKPALPRKAAMRLVATEYDRMAATLARLQPGDWSKPTDCPDWDVRQLACHMVGMATMMTSPREASRQQKLAGRAQQVNGGPMVDSLTALQVRERDGLSPGEIVAAARKVAPRAVRGRKLTPGLIRRRTAPGTQLVNGTEETWTIGFMVDVILTRDPWMHRIDLAHATGHELELTADHDGVLVDDVVREWADRHARAYRLELTGAAGGTWASVEQPDDTETITMDAIEFCRILSGRGTGAGLLSTQVPF